MQLTDWDHNAWYHRLLLRQLPDGAERVLDVGCGAGTLARRLAARGMRVDAFDASPVMVAAATRGAPDNLAVHQADALTVVLPTGGYDAVLSSAVLHHLPLEVALPRMAGWLRPGGVLAAVALRRSGSGTLPRELAAVTTHQALGLAFAVGRSLSRQRFFAPEATHDSMPVRPPELTTREVRTQAQALLPGAEVRELLLWRYLLTWVKPGSWAGQR